MAIDFDAVAPIKSKGLAKRTRGASLPSVNPFVTKDWLMNSYNSGEAFEFPCSGAWEEYEIRSGVRKGEKAQRLIGDAATVMKLIRKGASDLMIGVRTEVEVGKFTAGRNKGQPNGEMVIKYLAQPVRKTKAQLAREAAKAAEAAKNGSPEVKTQDIDMELSEQAAFVAE